MVTGTVVNASRGKTPAPDTEVVLRVRLGEEFVPFHQTQEPMRGAGSASTTFRSEGTICILPGANRDGVHYPGPPSK